MKIAAPFVAKPLLSLLDIPGRHFLYIKIPLAQAEVPIYGMIVKLYKKKVINAKFVVMNDSSYDAVTNFSLYLQCSIFIPVCYHNIGF